MQNVGLDEAPAGIKMARRNINNLRYADDTTLMAESEEELKLQHSLSSAIVSQTNTNVNFPRGPNRIWLHNYITLFEI